MSNSKFSVSMYYLNGVMGNILCLTSLIFSIIFLVKEEYAYVMVYLLVAAIAKLYASKCRYKGKYLEYKGK